MFGVWWKNLPRHSTTISTFPRVFISSVPRFMRHIARQSRLLRAVPLPFGIFFFVGPSMEFRLPPAILLNHPPPKQAVDLNKQLSVWTTLGSEGKRIPMPVGMWRTALNPLICLSACFLGNAAIGGRTRINQEQRMVGGLVGQAAWTRFFFSSHRGLYVITLAQLIPLIHGLIASFLRPKKTE